MFYLRWCFIYRDGKKRTGLWSAAGSSNEPDTQAWAQPTNGLAHACIEGMHYKTRKTIILAEITGQDFCSFQWIGTVPLSGGKHAPQIRGMVLVSRELEIDVHSTGQVVPRLKKINDALMLYGRSKQ